MKLWRQVSPVARLWRLAVKRADKQRACRSIDVAQILVVTARVCGVSSVRQLVGVVSMLS